MSTSSPDLASAFLRSLILSMQVEWIHEITSRRDRGALVDYWDCGWVFPQKDLLVPEVDRSHVFVFFQAPRCREVFQTKLLTLVYE